MSDKHFGPRVPPHAPLTPLPAKAPVRPGPRASVPKPVKSWAVQATFNCPDCQAELSMPIDGTPVSKCDKCGARWVITISITPAPDNLFGGHK